MSQPTSKNKHAKQELYTHIHRRHENKIAHFGSSFSHIFRVMHVRHHPLHSRWTPLTPEDKPFSSVRLGFTCAGTLRPPTPPSIQVFFRPTHAAPISGTLSPQIAFAPSASVWLKRDCRDCRTYCANSIYYTCVDALFRVVFFLFRAHARQKC